MASSNRKISVIMIADAVGYSKHMEANEDATLASYKECEAILKDLLKKHDGSIFNTAGDSVLTEFSSAVNAVECGVEFQRAIKEKNAKQDNQVNIEFRVGINMGDVVETDGNLLGDGVNIAARLEALSMPGGVSISKSVHDMIVGKTKLTFKNQGLQKVKQNEFYVYDVVIDPKKTRTLKTKAKTSKAMTIGSAVVVASIAAVLFIVNPFKEQANELNKIVVLPLETNSKDQDQINLAVGLTQDISGALTGASKQLNIINVNKVPDELSQIHEQMQASYLIKGSLRFAADNLRVSINLIDAKTLSNIWTDNYDRKFEISSIFQIQDEIVKNIVDELVGNGAVLSKDIAKNISSKGTTNLSAYECVNFVRGQFFKVLSTDLHVKSLECLKQSVIDDPEYKEAWQLLSQMYTWGVALFARLPKEESYKQAEIAVDNALRIDKDFARAYASKFELYIASGRMDAGFDYGEKAVQLAPNDAATVGIVSYLTGIAGAGCHSPNELLVKYEINRDDDCTKLDRSYELAKLAHKLDEGNIYSYDNYGLGNYYLFSKNWKKVVEVYEKIPNPGFVWWVNSMALAYHGMNDEINAKDMFKKLDELAGPNSIDRIANEFGTWGKLRIIFDEMLPVYKQYGLN